MKRIEFYMCCYLMLLIFASACTEQIDNTGNNRHIVINASMPDAGVETRVGIERSNSSLDLIAKWKEDDKISLFIVQDGKSYTLPSAPIRNISDNGKRCTFSFELPSDVSPYWPYEIYGLCDAEGYPSEDQVPVDENGNFLYDITVLAKSQLKRVHWNQWSDGFAPMWFHATGGLVDFYANFRHLGTYEVLHIKNTATEIMFRHDGFDVEVPWYKSYELTPLIEDYDPTKYVEEVGDDVSSGDAYIGPGQTGIILSWYIPNGAFIQDAKLLATINGKRVVSSNSKSSSIKILRGHAYHMYATWDGTELKFEKGNVTAESAIVVDPMEINFGEVNIGSSEKRYLTIFNCGEKQEEVKVTIEGHGTYDGQFELPEADLGDDYISKVIPAGENSTVEISFRASTAEEYNGNLAVTSAGIQGGSYVVPLKGKGIEEDKSFHLSANSIEMYVNTEELVMILNGSGEYEVTNENPDIVDYDINGIHVAQSPRRSDGTTGGLMSDDCWWIMAKKIGNATLKLTDKKTKEELTLKVKVSQAPSLTLAKNNVELQVGNTENIEILAGSEWYEVTTDNPSVVSASKTTISTGGGGGRDEGGSSHTGIYAVIEALADGNAIVTVKDLSSGETAEIKVAVGDGYNVPAEAIDLGLPSGTLWASCNVGATKPEEFGGYYAWGETQEKDSYTWGNYSLCTDGDKNTCYEIEDIGGTNYDVASSKWGNGWRTPSPEQLKELVEYCTYQRTNLNNVRGCKFIGPNGNSIFLPSAGYRWEDNVEYLGTSGHYMSSASYYKYDNWSLCTDVNNAFVGVGGRFYGENVRPVRSK